MYGAVAMKSSTACNHMCNLPYRHLFTITEMHTSEYNVSFKSFYLSTRRGFNWIFFCWALMPWPRRPRWHRLPVRQGAIAYLHNVVIELNSQCCGSLSPELCQGKEGLSSDFKCLARIHGHLIFFNTLQGSARSWDSRFHLFSVTLNCHASSYYSRPRNHRYCASAMPY